MPSKKEVETQARPSCCNRAIIAVHGVHRAANPARRRRREDFAEGDSIRINDQWRICFTWKNDGPYDVEIVDYH